MLALGIVLPFPFVWASSFFGEAAGITSKEGLSALNMLVDLLASCLMLAIPLYVIKRWVGIPGAAAFPMRLPRFSVLTPAVFMCFGAAVLGSYAYGITALILDALFGIVLHTPDIMLPVGPVATALYLVRMILVPAVFEELLFRGAVMQPLRRFGDSFALFCSALVFGAAHQNLAQGMSGFCFAIVIGFFVLRTGSVFTGIVAHFTHNALVAAAELIKPGLNERAALVLSSVHLAVYAVLGFAGLVWLIASRSNIFSLAPSGYPVSALSKLRAFFLSGTAFVYYALLTAISLFIRYFVLGQSL
jgi:membrane protease YdiL (CAAX protease family)